MTSTRKFRLSRKWLTASDIVGLELVPIDGEPLDLSPGSHVEFKLRRPGAPPMLRHYSLCNAPHERDVLIFGVKREPASRGGSAMLHDFVKEGDTIDLGAPRNHFPLIESAQRHLLLGAGIGVTPLLAMAQSLAASGADYQLHYFTRSAEHVAFPERLAGGQAAGRVHLHLGLSAGETLDALRVALQSPAERDHAYACGPGAFMDAVSDIAKPLWGPDRVHFEHFQPAASVPATEDTAFEVELRKSGMVCTVLPGETIVQALEFAGCPVDVSCEQGVCGTCLTRVLEGRPDHRDSYLSDAERAKGDLMLVCVSRAQSARLVLDR